MADKFDLFGDLDRGVALALSGWQRNGWRWSISYARGARPFKTRLVSYTESETCKTRVGTMDGGPGT